MPGGRTTARSRYSIVAGNPVYAPVPMRNLLDIQPCAGTQAAKEVAARSRCRSGRTGRAYSGRGAVGNMQMLYYYPLQPGFALTVSSRAIELGLVATRITDQEFCADQPDRRVRAVAPRARDTARSTIPAAATGSTRSPTRQRWPDLPALLNVGETVYQRAKGGVSAVATQVAVARIYDDLAPGRWNNDVGRIEITGTQVVTYLAQLIDPLDEVKVELPLRAKSTPALPAEHRDEPAALSAAGCPSWATRRIRT